MSIRRYTDRESEPVTTYLLRAIPAKLWKSAKLRALKDDLDMRAVILRLLERYVKYGLEEPEKR